ncbi:hypothetical protein MHYP_G00229970 [Metynnis hypsauchen]
MLAERFSSSGLTTRLQGVQLESSPCWVKLHPDLMATTTNPAQSHIQNLHSAVSHHPPDRATRLLSKQGGLFILGARHAAVWPTGRRTPPHPPLPPLPPPQPLPAPPSQKAPPLPQQSNSATFSLLTRLQCSFPFRGTDNGSWCRSRVDRLAGQTPTHFSRHPEVELDRTCGARGHPGDQ